MTTDLLPTTPDALRIIYERYKADVPNAFARAIAQALPVPGDAIQHTSPQCRCFQKAAESINAWWENATEWQKKAGRIHQAMANLPHTHNKEDWAKTFRAEVQERFHLPGNVADSVAGHGPLGIKDMNRVAYLLARTQASLEVVDQ